MPFNIKSTISDYENTLSNYIKNIHIDNSLSNYEKLDILSDILLSLRLMNKFLPVEVLSVNSLYIFKEPGFEKPNLMDVGTNNILVLLDEYVKNNIELLLHNYGVYLYNILLGEENVNINANVTKLCLSLADIFLNRTDDELDSYISIADNETNFLNFLCKPEQLFARAFKSFILYEALESYELKSSTDFTNNEYIQFKSSIRNVLLQSIKTIKGEELLANSSTNTLLNNLPDSITLAETKRCSKLEALHHLKEKDSSDCDIILLQKYIHNASYDFNIEDLFTNEMEQDNLSEKNTLNFKEDINSLTMEDIYELNTNLQEDINELRTEISLLDEEIQYIEGEIVKGKRSKKDKSLLELLRFNFFLSQEYRNKIKMQKALEYADETYTPEYINYSELKDKEKQMDKIITSEIENNNNEKDKNIKKIENTYTVHIDTIQSTIARALGVSPSKLKDAIRNLEESSNKKLNASTSWVKFKTKDIVPNSIDKKSYRGLTTNTHITNIIENKIKGKKLTNIKSKQPIKNKTKEMQPTIKTSYHLSHNNNNLFDKLLEEATVALAKDKELSKEDPSEYEI